MAEIWTAVSQDELMQVLAVLRNNGIEAQFKTDSTEADAFITTSLQLGAFRVYVEQEYAERSKQLLSDYFENPHEELPLEENENYSEFEDDILIHKLVDCSATEKRKILGELYNRGYTDTKIEEEITNYTEANRRYKESTSGWAAQVIIVTAKFFKFDVKMAVSKMPFLIQIIIALIILSGLFVFIRLVISIYNY
jgi:hypothetical protein